MAYGDPPEILSTRQFGEGYTARMLKAAGSVYVDAAAGGEVVGRLAWRNSPRDENNRVTALHVAPEHRRRGVATEMWGLASTHDRPPVHSPQRTEDGDAWARTVGGDLPPLEDGGYSRM